MRFPFVWLCALVAILVPLRAENPVLSLENPLVPELEVRGERGKLVTVEGAESLSPAQWDLLNAFILTNDTQRTRDVWCGKVPQRFYRVTTAEPGNATAAPNFRLLDHLGKSYEVRYSARGTNIEAFVFIFTSNGCEDVAEQLPGLKELHGRLAPRGVEFRMINSNPEDTRSSIANVASRLSIPWPILHDRAQTAARLYRIRKAPEVVVVRRDGLQILYRGPIDDRLEQAAGTPTRNYLEEVLEEHLEGREVSFRQVKSLGCDLTISPEQIDYARDIAPLLKAKCVVCHSPGNVAPWAMTNYNIVRAYAPLMQREIAAGNMPPWQADPHFGKFRNDRSLSSAEERRLMQWFAAGSPRGSGPDPLLEVPPPPPRWPVELGEPDVILRTPKQTTMANGEEPYRYIFVPTGFSSDKWIRAAVVQPTNRRVVHHYLVWEGQSTNQMASGIAGYVPGNQPTAFPQGTGLLLRAGTWLTFNLHYTPTGQVEEDQPELGLWFHQTPPAKTIQTLPLLNDTFRIPAGAREHEVMAEVPFVPANVTLYSLSPHMHVRGARMKFEVVYPGGARETLLSVPRYRFHWQTAFVLEQPKMIPFGSRIIVTGAFDNSPLNLMNPDPTMPVEWGDQSWEEMFIGYFDFTVN